MIARLKQFKYLNMLIVSLVVFLTFLILGKYTQSTALTNAQVVYATAVVDKKTGRKVRYKIEKRKDHTFKVTNTQTGKSIVSKPQTQVEGLLNKGDYYYYSRYHQELFYVSHHDNGTVTLRRTSNGSTWDFDNAKRANAYLGDGYVTSSGYANNSRPWYQFWTTHYYYQYLQTPDRGVISVNYAPSYHTIIPQTQVTTKVYDNKGQQLETQTEVPKNSPVVVPEASSSQASVSESSVASQSDSNSESSGSKDSQEKADTSSKSSTKSSSSDQAKASSSSSSSSSSTSSSSSEESPTYTASGLTKEQQNQVTESYGKWLYDTFNNSVVVQGQFNAIENLDVANAQVLSFKTDTQKEILAGVTGVTSKALPENLDVTNSKYKGTVLGIDLTSSVTEDYQPSSSYRVYSLKSGAHAIYTSLEEEAEASFDNSAVSTANYKALYKDKVDASKGSYQLVLGADGFVYYVDHYGLQKDKKKQTAPVYKKAEKMYQEAYQKALKTAKETQTSSSSSSSTSSSSTSSSSSKASSAASSSSSSVSDDEDDYDYDYSDDDYDTSTESSSAYTTPSESTATSSASSGYE